jgi:hypothetical protein
MEAVMEDIASRNPKAKGADPKQFYDPAPLEQLAKEGFIKEQPETHLFLYVLNRGVRERQSRRSTWDRFGPTLAGNG